MQTDQIKQEIEEIRQRIIAALEEQARIEATCEGAMVNFHGVFVSGPFIRRGKARLATLRKLLELQEDDADVSGDN